MPTRDRGNGAQSGRSKGDKKWGNATVSLMASDSQFQLFLRTLGSERLFCIYNEVPVGFYYLQPTRRGSTKKGMNWDHLLIEHWCKDRCSLLFQVIATLRLTAGESPDCNSLSPLLDLWYFQVRECSEESISVLGGCMSVREICGTVFDLAVAQRVQ